MSALHRKILNIYLKSSSLKKCVNIIEPLIPIRLKYGKEFVNSKLNIKKTEFMDKETHRKKAAANLVSIISHAFEYSEYYRQMLYSVGIRNLRDIDEKSIFNILESLPIINKDIIKENFEKVKCKTSKLASDYISTGGTSGEPFFFYINSDRSSKEWAFMTDQWGRIGFDLYSKRATFRGYKINGLYEDDPILKERRFSSFKLSDKYLLDIWKHFLEYNPNFIYGYPSSIYILAQFVKKYGVSIPESLQGILLGSENIYTEQRNYIERIFNVKSFIWYGHSEKLVLAGECEYDQIYHAYPQYGYVEFINKEGVKANPGEFAEIVGTGYINTVMPFIRYRTGDWCIYLGDKCDKCGRNYPIFKDIKGRWDQEMLLGTEGNLISVTAINIHSKEFHNVQRFQFYQDTPGEAILKIVVDKSFSKQDYISLLNIMNGKLQETIKLQILEVDEIPLTVSGKYKYIDQKLNLNKMYSNQKFK